MSAMAPDPETLPVSNSTAVGSAAVPGVVAPGDPGLPILGAIGHARRVWAYVGTHPTSARIRASARAASAHPVARNLTHALARMPFIRRARSRADAALFKSFLKVGLGFFLGVIATLMIRFHTTPAGAFQAGSSSVPAASRTSRAPTTTASHPRTRASASSGGGPYRIVSFGGEWLVKHAGKKAYISKKRARTLAEVVATIGPSDFR